MKELSIEDKAKAYDIALDKIKMLLGTGGSCSREELKYVFPELKESEDEKIRKEIISFVKSRSSQAANSAFNSWIAWLEKQGEQKPTDNEMIEILRAEYEKGRADAIEEMQNPAWSEEDETVLNNLIWTLKEDMVLTSDRDTYTSWLKSLKNRVQPQPKQEWSEEDEENFARVDYACLKVYGGDSYSSDWLRKFLGIHKKWKPSDEQMNALNDVISSRDIKYDVLSKLWEDLKKLKG